MIMAAQWFQPTDTIDPKKISDDLNAIAQRVLDLANIKKPEFDKSQLRARNLLVLLSEVLFREMGFTNEMESYYEPEKSFIDKVSSNIKGYIYILMFGFFLQFLEMLSISKVLERKTGNPITLCVMYLLIAKRLGVMCEPVGFPAHFLLRWEEHPL